MASSSLPLPGRITESILIIRLGVKRIGLDIRRIEEMLPMVEPSPLVDAPGFIAGAINVRGEIIRLVKLGVLLGLPSRPVDPDMFIIIGKVGEVKMGFVVDGIERLVHVDPEKTAGSGDVNNVSSQGFSRGLVKIEGEPVEVIDFSSLPKIREMGNGKERGDDRPPFFQENFCPPGQMNTLDKTGDEKKAAALSHKDEKAFRILQKRAKDLLQGAAEETEEQERWLLFLLEGNKYIFPGEFIDEVTRPGNIRRFPGLPDYVEGVINLRGEIIPVIGTKKFLGMRGKTDSKRPEEKAIVVLKERGSRWGFLVDGVIKNMDIALKKVQTPPIVSAPFSARYIMGQIAMEDGVAVILNAGMMIKEGEAGIRHKDD